MSKKKQPENFEQALKRLEEIAEQIEQRATGLEESLELYVEGQALIDYCGAKLADAEKKIKILIKQEGTGFSLQEEDLDEGES